MAHETHHTEHSFADRHALAQMCTVPAGNRPMESVNCRGSAALIAVSGGKSSILLFNQLANMAVSWPAVFVALQPGEAEYDASLRALNLSFDAVLLGMGVDGHIAYLAANQSLLRIRKARCERPIAEMPIRAVLRQNIVPVKVWHSVAG